MMADNHIAEIRERLRRSEVCNPAHAKWTPTLFCWQGDIGFLLQAYDDLKADRNKWREAAAKNRLVSGGE